MTSPNEGGTTSPADQPALTDTYGATVRQRIHLDDLDGFGVLYHANYAVLVDRAILDYWLGAGWNVDPQSRVQVIRDLHLRYHRPIRSMGWVDVRFWVDRAGYASVRYQFEIRGTDGQVHADGYRTLVNLDTTTTPPTPTPFGRTEWERAAPLLAPGVERRSA